GLLEPRVRDDVRTRGGRGRHHDKEEHSDRNHNDSQYVHHEDTPGIRDRQPQAVTGERARERACPRASHEAPTARNRTLPLPPSPPPSRRSFLDESSPRL